MSPLVDVCDNACSLCDEVGRCATLHSVCVEDNVYLCADCILDLLSLMTDSYWRPTDGRTCPTELVALGAGP